MKEKNIERMSLISYDDYNESYKKKYESTFFNDFYYKIPNVTKSDSAPLLEEALETMLKSNHVNKEILLKTRIQETDSIISDIYIRRVNSGLYRLLSLLTTSLTKVIYENIKSFSKDNMNYYCYETINSDLLYEFSSIISLSLSCKSFNKDEDENHNRIVDMIIEFLNDYAIVHGTDQTELKYVLAVIDDGINTMVNNILLQYYNSFEIIYINSHKYSLSNTIQYNADYEDIYNKIMEQATDVFKTFRVDLFNYICQIRTEVVNFYFRDDIFGVKYKKELDEIIEMESNEQDDDEESERKITVLHF